MTSLRPLFDIGHLYTSCRVHPVGRFNQAGEKNWVEDRVPVLRLNSVTYCINSRTIEWLEETRLLTEHLSEVPGIGGEIGEIVQCIVEFTLNNGVAIKGDVTLSKNFRVAGEVDGSNKSTSSFELLGYAGGTREEVESRGRTGGGEDVSKGRD